MGFSVPQLLIILVIALILFGSKKLKSLGSDLGEGLKSFRSAVKDADEITDKPADASTAGRVIEGEAESVQDKDSKSTT